jgi:hypothetical protein
VIANNNLRPEPCKVQGFDPESNEVHGCRAPDVVHGGLRIMRIEEFVKASNPMNKIPNNPPAYQQAGINQYEIRNQIGFAFWRSGFIWDLDFGIWSLNDVRYGV